VTCDSVPTSTTPSSFGTLMRLSHNPNSKLPSRDPSDRTLPQSIKTRNAERTYHSRNGSYELRLFPF
jgi:hypothetical protein